jgi:hypothetical protein
MTQLAPDPEDDTATLAREVLRLLNSNAKLQRILELARATLDHPTEARACKSLAELDACMNAHVGKTPAFQPPDSSQHLSVQKLVAATHQVAELAIQTASEQSPPEICSECMRLAKHCQAAESRLRNTLLWHAQ